MSLTRNTERKDQVVQNMEASKYSQTTAHHTREDLAFSGVHVSLPLTPCLVQLSWHCIMYVGTVLHHCVECHACNSLLEEEWLFLFVSVVSFIFLTTHYIYNEYKNISHNSSFSS